MITIIDYGIGNIGSIANMLKKIGEPSVITADPEAILDASKLILCGVGAFDDGMEKLGAKNLIGALKQKVQVEKVPILGVCLGMQLFADNSEEGKTAGLGFIPAEVKKFKFDQVESEKKLHIPHMGWNSVHLEKESRIFENMHPDPRFYFVHSFYFQPASKAEVFLSTSYGIQFCAGVEHDNIVGVQFHPEKSHKFGIRLYENFVKNY